MRDSQLIRSLQKWNGVIGGGIFSNKPNEQKNLSEILESSVSEKYHLSPKACAGILRRAEKRGKELPPQLARALKEVAGSERISTATAA